MRSSLVQYLICTIKLPRSCRTGLQICYQILQILDQLYASIQSGFQLFKKNAIVT